MIECDFFMRKIREDNGVNSLVCGSVVTMFRQETRSSVSS